MASISHDAQAHYWSCELAIFGGVLGVTAGLLMAEIGDAFMGNSEPLGLKFTLATILAAGYFVPPIFLSLAFDHRRTVWAGVLLAVVIYPVVYYWMRMVAVQVDYFPTLKTDPKIAGLVAAVAFTNWLWPFAHWFFRFLGRAR